MAADLVFPPAALPDIIRALQKDEVYVRVSARGGPFQRGVPSYLLHLLGIVFGRPLRRLRAAARRIPRGTRLRHQRLHFPAHSLSLHSLFSERYPLGLRYCLASVEVSGWLTANDLSRTHSTPSHPTRPAPAPPPPNRCRATPCWTQRGGSW